MQGSWLYPRVRSAVDFIVPIPAFFYFKAAGFIRRQARIAGYVVGIVLGGIALATLAFGRHLILYQITNILIIAGLIVVVARSVRQPGDNQDLVVIRRALGNGGESSGDGSPRRSGAGEEAVVPHQSWR